MPKIKRCPFCGNNQIGYSLKVTGHFDVRYHAQMYCKKCRTYGPRVLTKISKHDDYKNRQEIENDKKIKEEAIEKWNKRNVNEKLFIKTLELLEIQTNEFCCNFDKECFSYKYKEKEYLILNVQKTYFEELLTTFNINVEKEVDSYVNN